MNYKNIYKEAVKELNPSPELINSIKTSKENKIVKLSRKKAAVVAAVACMAVGTTVFAAGRITSYMSWGDPHSADYNYANVEKYMEKNGLAADIPETLSSGYAFTSSDIGGVKGNDDKGNVVAEGETFNVTYSKDGAPDIYLSVEPTFQQEDRSYSTEIREIEGTAVYYNHDTYKFVPADYKCTDEDSQKEESGHYFISYGSDKVEVKSADSIVFEANGKNYTLFGFENNMNVGEWFAMAEDFIK